MRGWAVGAFVPELSSASEVPVNRQWGVCLSVLLQGRTIDFVDVNESNARWVQDFRLKAYASPAKLESIDGEGPWGLEVWDPGGVRGLQSAPLLLFLTHLPRSAVTEPPASSLSVTELPWSPPRCPVPRPPDSQLSRGPGRPGQQWVPGPHPPALPLREQ